MNHQQRPLSEQEALAQLAEKLRQLPTRQAPATLLPAIEERLKQRDAYFSTPHTQQELLAALQNERWEIRSAAVELLGATGEQDVLSLLLDALQDENPFVHESANWALKQLEEKASVNPSISASQNHNQDHQQERRKSMITQPPELSLVTKSAQSNTPGHTIFRRPRGWRLGVLVAGTMLALFLMAAAVLQWWNPRFGSPDLYQVINQQQTSMGVTITVTRVYADEGRTIIAYDISAPGTNKDYLVVGAFDLSSPIPQKQEPLSDIECDAPQAGITHCYMVQAAFLVPAGVDSLPLTLDFTQVADRSEAPPISGQWHFSFTVPFHHEIRNDIPKPFEGGCVVPAGSDTPPTSCGQS